MKRIFTLIFLAAAMPSFSQSINKGLCQLPGHRQLISNMLHNPAASTAAMKTTSGVSMTRVIAQTTKDNTLGSLNDSVAIKYNTGRASYYDFNTMLYPYNYPYNSSPMFNFGGVFTTPQVMFDTLRHWTIDPNTLAYGYYETDIAGWDGLNNLTSYKALYADSSFYPNMVYANNFAPASHKLNVGYASNWISGVADSAFKQYFTYNTAGQLIADSTYELHLGVWRISSKSYYTYDGSNDLVRIDNYTNNTDTSLLLPLVENLQYINTYDASHRLLTVESNFLYSGGLSPYVLDTLAYTGTHTFNTSWREYQYDTINHYWAPIFNMIKTLGSTGLPDTVSTQGFDSLLNTWVPQSRWVMHYNGTNDPDTLKDYEYNFTAWPAIPNFTTVYYYQTYLNTLNTANSEPVSELLLFPNPATTTVTLAHINAATNAQIILSLINMKGQLVRREALSTTGNTQLSVSDLVPGTYQLVIQDMRGSILHRHSFVKE
jgi:Secretion system C-terminal sorting domain